MPRHLDPNNTFDVWLESDAQKPEERRPIFSAKYLSGAVWLEVAAIKDRINAQSAPEDALGDIYSGLTKCISGWRNMTQPDGTLIPFSQDALPLVLGPGEAIELLDKAVRQSDMKVADAKKSESPSPSSTDNSVEAVEDGEATANPSPEPVEK